MARTGDSGARRPAHAVAMTEAQNAATYRRWFDEGCSQGNVDLADELYSPEYVTHSLGPQFAPTLEGLKMFIRALREGVWRRPILQAIVALFLGAKDTAFLVRCWPCVMKRWRSQWRRRWIH